MLYWGGLGDICCTGDGTCMEDMQTLKRWKYFKLVMPTNASFNKEHCFI